MASLDPQPEFATVELDIASIGPGKRFSRIYLSRYPDPLGFGKSPSRFSDPRPLNEEDRFGVLYLGQTLEVCFLEAVLRDRRNGVVGHYPIAESELHNRRFALIEPITKLRFVDLRGSNCVRMGIPSDVPRAANQRLAQQWSLTIHEHPSRPDGIVYSSRLNGHTNLAVYDRAVTNLRVIGNMKLIEAPRLARVLGVLKVAIV